MFISKKNYLAEVKNVIRNGERLDIAVAFWGEGSDELIALSRSKAARVVCNLSSGGTNPGPIRKIISQGVNVRQLDDLHAKVIIGDDSAIVGSANLSTNGLQLELEESAGWTEAGMLVSSVEDLKDISAWFEAEWARTRTIEISDLDKAETAWKLRRAARPKIKQVKTLFEFAPRDVKDFNAFVVIWSEDASDGATAAYEELVSRAEEKGVLDHALLSKLSFYEDLGAVPEKASLISFQRHSKGKYSCDGIWRRLEELDVPPNDAHGGLHIVVEHDRVLDIKIAGPQRKELEKNLRPVLESLWEEFKGAYGGAIIPLDEALAKLRR